MRKLYLISAFSLFWFAGVSQTYNLQIGDPVDGGILAEFPNNSQALFRPYGTATGNTGGIRLFELSANGSNYIGLRAEDNIGSNLMFTLPGSAPGVNGAILTTTTGGTMSWTDVLPVANGGTGSSTQNWVDLTTNQTAAGQKTWSDLGTFSAGLLSSNGTAAAPAIAFSSQTNTGMYWAGSNDLRLAINGTWRFRVGNGWVQVNGTVRPADGTVALPAYTFSNETDMGMWRAGADILAFSTAATERMRIDATGTVQLNAYTTNGLLKTVSGNGTLAVATAGTDYDPSITNEGSLTVGAGTATTSLINSNTSGSTPVTLTAGMGLTSSESSNTITTAFDYAATLSSEPVAGTLGANQSVFGSNGLIFEGSSADANEGYLTVANPTADRTWTLPNASGTVAVSASSPLSLSAAGDVSFSGWPANASGLLSNNGSGTLSWISAATISPSGITDYVARWTSATSIGTGVIRDNNSTVGVNMAPNASRMLSATTATTTANGAGLWGEATGNAQVYGVFGNTSSTTANAAGVRGHASGASGATFGVWGENNSTAGYGVYGIANATSGTIYGVAGIKNAASNGGTGYGVYGSASGYNSGTVTNIGGYFTASGATNNYGLIVPSGGGNVGIGNNAPDAQLHIGTHNRIKNGTWADPATPNTVSAGERFVLYEGGGWKTAIGMGTQNDIWFQAHGAAADPAFRWFSGTNASAPVERMRIASNGNVGIGTTTTTDRLIVGTAMAFHNGGHQVIGMAWSPGSGNTLMAGRPAEIRLDPTTGTLSFGTDPTTRVSGAAAGVQTRMNISSNGLVSIGSSSQFQVNNSGNLIRINNVAYSWPPAQGGANSILRNDGSGNLSWAAAGSTGGGLPSGTSGQTLRHDGSNWVANSVLYNNGTNVGISSTAPTARLDVVGPATGSGITIKAGGGGDVVLASGGSLFFDNNYSYASGNYIRPVAANTQAFFTAGAERMRITSNGNVGIGSTAPAQRLDVNGNIHLGSSTGNKQIYTWSATDGNWRIGMSASPGFTRAMATSHVQYLTYSTSAGQGFAVGVNGGNSGFEIRGSDHQAYFRGKVGVNTTAPVAMIQATYNSAGEDAIYGQNTASNGTGVNGSGQNTINNALIAGSGGAFNGVTTGSFHWYSTGGVGEAAYFADNYGAFWRLGHWTGSAYRKLLGNAGTVSTMVKDLNDEFVIMNCPETPENLYLDYGTGKLINGKAHIDIDPILAKNIIVNEKHPLKVFVQLEGDCNGVYVTNKTAQGFDVIELNGGSSTVDFSYTLAATMGDQTITAPDGKTRTAKYDTRWEKPAPPREQKIYQNVGLKNEN